MACLVFKCKFFSIFHLLNMLNMVFFLFFRLINAIQQVIAFYGVCKTTLLIYFPLLPMQA